MTGRSGSIELTTSTAFAEVQQTSESAFTSAVLLT